MPAMNNPARRLQLVRQQFRGPGGNVRAVEEADAVRVSGDPRAPQQVVVGDGRGQNCRWGTTDSGVGREVAGRKGPGPVEAVTEFGNGRPWVTTESAGVVSVGSVRHVAAAPGTTLYCGCRLRKASDAGRAKTRLRVEHVLVATCSTGATVVVTACVGEPCCSAYRAASGGS